MLFRLIGNQLVDPDAMRSIHGLLLGLGCQLPAVPGFADELRDDECCACSMDAIEALVRRKRLNYTEQSATTLRDALANCCAGKEQPGGLVCDKRLDQLTAESIVKALERSYRPLSRLDDLILSNALHYG